jgi:hypothetical protein
MSNCEKSSGLSVTLAQGTSDSTPEQLKDSATTGARDDINLRGGFDNAHYRDRGARNNAAFAGQRREWITARDIYRPECPCF